MLLLNKAAFRLEFLYLEIFNFFIAGITFHPNDEVIYWKRYTYLSILGRMCLVQYSEQYWNLLYIKKHLNSDV